MDGILIESPRNANRQFVRDAIAARHRVEPGNGELLENDRGTLLDAERHSNPPRVDGVDTCDDLGAGEAATVVEDKKAELVLADLERVETPLRAE